MGNYHTNYSPEVWLFLQGAYIEHKWEMSLFILHFIFEPSAVLRIWWSIRCVEGNAMSLQETEKQVREDTGKKCVCTCVRVCVCPALFVILAVVFGDTLLICQTDSLRCRNRSSKQKLGGLELSLHFDF